MELRKTEVHEPPKRDHLSLMDHFAKYFWANPLTFSATLFLFFGALLLLVFFLRVGQMPEVNFESITSLLYAIAVLGIFFVAFTTLALIAPGLLLSEARAAVVGVRSGHIAGAALGAVAIWIVVFFKMFQLLNLSAIFFVGILVIVFLSGISITIQLAGGLKREENNNTLNAKKHKFSPKVGAFAWVFCTTFGLAILLTVAFAFVGVLGMAGDIRTANSSSAVLSLSALALFLGAAAAVIGASPKAMATRMAALIALPSLFVVLVVTGSFSAFAAIPVRLLGQGEIAAVRLAVDGKTCREINTGLGQQVCLATGDESPAAICPVIMTSRIGSQVVLDFAYLHATDEELKKGHAFWVDTTGAENGASGRRLTRRIIVEKAKILNWQPLPAFGKRDESAVHIERPSKVETWLAPQSCKALKASSPDRLLCELIEERCGSKPDSDDAASPNGHPSQKDSK